MKLNDLWALGIVGFVVMIGIVNLRSCVEHESVLRCRTKSATPEKCTP